MCVCVRESVCKKRTNAADLGGDVRVGVNLVVGLLVDKTSGDLLLDLSPVGELGLGVGVPGDNLDGVVGDGSHGSSLGGLGGLGGSSGSGGGSSVRRLVVRGLGKAVARAELGTVS